MGEGEGSWGEGIKGRGGGWRAARSRRNYGTKRSSWITGALNLVSGVWMRTREFGRRRRDGAM